MNAPNVIFIMADDHAAKAISASGGEDKEWELFDCQSDQLELSNLANNQNFDEIFTRMKLLFIKKCSEKVIFLLTSTN